MQYNLQASRLSGDHSAGTCTLLKGLNGEKLIAIASGHSDGIEVWNPADGSVTILNSTFPLRNGRSQMIAVNGNTELIFYESGYSSSSFKGIWKFSQVCFF